MVVGAMKPRRKTTEEYSDDILNTLQQLCIAACDYQKKLISTKPVWEERRALARAAVAYTRCIHAMERGRRRGKR